MDWGVASGIATLVAMLAFLGVVAYTMSRRRQADYDRLAQLPLEEDVHS